MGWTKRQLIEDAFGELALAGYVFDLTPEELQAAKRRMDLMMASWAGVGLHMGYLLDVVPTDGDIDNDSGIPLNAGLAVSLNLAVSLAAGKGKALSASTKASAKAAYDALISRLATESVTEQQFRSGTPHGQGSKPWRRINQPFLPLPTTSPLRGDGSGGLDISESGA